MKWYKCAALRYSQQHLTEEAQFDHGKGLHPRQKRPRTRTTEKQLEEDWPGYELHTRAGRARGAVTERQLSEKHKGYDHHLRSGEVRDETHELQLRNTAWRSNATPAMSPPQHVWAENVLDQHQQITQAQLEDHSSAKPRRHLPKHTITETQLHQDLDEQDPLRRRAP